MKLFIGIIIFLVASFVFGRVVPYITYMRADGVIVSENYRILGGPPVHYLVEYEAGGEMRVGGVRYGIDRFSLHVGRKVTVLYDENDFGDIEIYDYTYFIPEFLIIGFLIGLGLLANIGTKRGLTVSK